MSSKVFEYLQAGRPVFAISPAGSAARALFAEVGGGTCVLPDDPMAEPLAAFVRRCATARRPARRPGGPGALRAGPPHRRAGRHPRRPRRRAAGGRHAGPTPASGPLVGSGMSATPDHAGRRARRTPLPRATPRCSPAARPSPSSSPPSLVAPAARGLALLVVVAAVAARPAEPARARPPARRRAPRRRPRRAAGGRSARAFVRPARLPPAFAFRLVLAVRRRRRRHLPRRAPRAAAVRRARTSRCRWRSGSPGSSSALAWAPDKAGRPSLPRHRGHDGRARAGDGGLPEAAAAASVRSASPWSSPTPSSSGFTVLEARLGIRLPTSRLVDRRHLADLRRHQRLPQPERPRHVPRDLLALHALRLLLHAARALARPRRARSSPSAPPPSCAPARARAWWPSASRPLAAVVLFCAPRRAALGADRQDRRRRWSPSARRRRPAICCSTTPERHAAPVPPGGAVSQAQAEQGLGRDPHEPDERGLEIAGGTLPPRRRARSGRGHHLLGHRRPRHRQPAQLVARDVRRRRPRRLRPPPRLLRAPGARAVADRARRPRPVRALPRQRHGARPAGLRPRRAGPEQLRELRADVDPVRARAGGDLALPAGGGRVGGPADAAAAVRGRRDARRSAA